MAKTAILALKNCMESCVSGIYDILTVASMEWQKHQGKTTKNLFELSVSTPDGEPVTSFTGTTIHPSPGTERKELFDIVIVPVLHGDLTPLLEDSDLIQWLHDLGKQGTILCSVCAGTFLIAQTGLLNGKTATTHWGLAREFESRFPQVILNQERMIVDEGNFISAGGVTAYMDLSLYLAGRFGSPELISTLSK